MERTLSKRAREIIPTPPVLDPVERTSEGIRDALFDELNLLRAGRVDALHARTVANLCRTIIEAARLELSHTENVKKVSAGREQMRLGK